MSRKFIDDSVEYRGVLDGIQNLPSQDDTRYEPGHLFLDPHSGLRFKNEGASDRESSLFVNEQWNALILFDALDRKPVIAADQAAGFNFNLTVAGVDAVSADVAFSPSGGAVLSTHGASADSTSLIVNVSTGHSIWGSASFAPDHQIVFETDIVTGASVVATTIYAGLKLTNTSVTATDNDQTFFRYQDTVNGGVFQFIDSTGGVDNVQNGQAGFVVQPNTAYFLQIKVGQDLAPRYYINAALVGVGKPLATGTVLKPFIGILAGAAAVKSVTVRNVRIVVPRNPIV